MISAPQQARLRLAQGVPAIRHVAAMLDTFETPAIVIGRDRTIVAANAVENCSGSVDSLGYNLADDETCALGAPGDLVVADAMLGPLTDNGGPTETHALLPGSPAIDATGPDCPPPSTDQRGVARPRAAQ